MHGQTPSETRPTDGLWLSLVNRLSLTEFLLVIITLIALFALAVIVLFAAGGDDISEFSRKTLSLLITVSALGLAQRLRIS